MGQDRLHRPPKNSDKKQLRILLIFRVMEYLKELLCKTNILPFFHTKMSYFSTFLCKFANKTNLIYYDQ